MERKLATIRRITEIENIEGADRIQLARVDGWQSVVKKGEFRVGDNVIFIEIDSILPFEPWSEFLRDKKDPEKPIRLKTCKLRGTLSQGIILPLSVIFDYDGPRSEGDDVTDYLKITKYEPAIAANLAGKAKGNFPTHLFPKTDSERIQNLWSPKFLDEIDGVKFVARFKEDGTSFTSFGHHGVMGICSRNLMLDMDDGSVYKQMFEKYNFEELFKRIDRNLAIQAEIIGPGIQKNSSGVSEKQIRVFDIFDIDKQKYFNYDELWNFCEVNYLPQVTTLTDSFVFDRNVHTMEYILKMTEQKYHGTNTQIEGLVFTPVEEMISKRLQGRLRFKMINPNYLLVNE